MSLPTELDNEINVLTREFAKQKPSDVLQFCANHFLRRLEAQRAEFLLGATHSTQRAGRAAVAESNFPGGNPFGAASDDSSRRMQVLREEANGNGNDDDDDFLVSPDGPAQSPRSTSNMDTATKSVPSSSGFHFEGFAPDGKLSPMAGGNLPTNYHFNRRTSVSAESMNPAETASDNWTPPFHQKTGEQQARLKKAVANNFIFSHLDDEQATQVLGALMEKSIPAKGIKVIEQGQAGDFFYVVEKGMFDIYVNPTGQLENGSEGMGKRVNAIGPGGSFGELALMYNAPRAATVISTGPSTLWALDRITFRRILMDSAFQRRKMYESFLAEVKLFESLTDYERSKIADALSTQKYPAGHTIIKEGDVGDHFYILESGEAEVYKRGVEAPVRVYGKGDYFGELALLDDKPRAASVISSSEVKLATLGKEGFQRLLGSVESIMRRNDPRQGANSDGNIDPLAKAA